MRSCVLACPICDRQAIHVPRVRQMRSGGWTLQIRELVCSVCTTQVAAINGSRQEKGLRA